MGCDYILSRDFIVSGGTRRKSQIEVIARNSAAFGIFFIVFVRRYCTLGTSGVMRGCVFCAGNI